VDVDPTGTDKEYSSHGGRGTIIFASNPDGHLINSNHDRGRSVVTARSQGAALGSRELSPDLDVCNTPRNQMSTWFRRRGFLSLFDRE